MTPSALWRRLAALGIGLSVVEGDLELEGDLDALDDDLIAAIRMAKPELLAWLAAREIRPRSGGVDFPLSHQQQRLWFIQQLDPAGAAYNLPAAFRIRGALDVARLEAVLDRIAARHAALRSRFVDSAGTPRQEVLPPGASSIGLRRHDLGMLAAGARLAEAQRLAAEEAGRPFDLARAPLIRAVLLRLTADDHLLVITHASHHCRWLVHRDADARGCAAVAGRNPVRPRFWTTSITRCGNRARVRPSRMRRCAGGKWHWRICRRCRPFRPITRAPCCPPGWVARSTCRLRRR
jgi:hypothetical protein